MEDECRRLAREGERATRDGNAQKGIRKPSETLSKVSCRSPSSNPTKQLGNAYYAQKLYAKALTYHGNDLMLSRVQKDVVQQAKAYSNMSATYTMLNDFDQAITCADNVICLARKLDDKGLECRGLYNLGLAHLQNAVQGAHESADDVVFHLHEAVKEFERHLELAKERKDDILCGLAVGNLGNAHFYLGDYEQSIVYHLRRLDMARALGDKSSMRRSFTNMGNAYVLLGNYDEALKCYRCRLALQIAVDPATRIINIKLFRYALEIAAGASRRNTEAQLLFSLGNVETLRGNHKPAAIYYLKHLRLARSLKDSAGETRANASLASTLVQLNQLPAALYFLASNYELSEKLGEESMKRNTLEEIKKLVKLNPSAVVSEDRVLVNSSLDPDALLEKSSAEQQHDGPIRDGKARSIVPVNTEDLQVPLAAANSSFQSMPNLSMSISLESFIKECARGSSSTPKRSAGVTLGAEGMPLPTPKCGDKDDLSSAIGGGNATVNRVAEPDGEKATATAPVDANQVRTLTRRALVCSRSWSTPTNGDAEEDEEEEGMSELTRDEFFDRLERIQGNRINEQRADPEILKDRTNDDRLSDSLNQPPPSEHRRISLGMTTLRSMSSHLQRNVLKSLSSNTSRLTSRLHHQQQPKQQRRPRHVETSTKKTKGTKEGGSSQRVTSPQFRVPRLPSEKDFATSDVTMAARRPVTHHTAPPKRENPETALLDLIESLQGRRMDEQRANLVLPGLKNPKKLLEKLTTAKSSQSEGSTSLEGDDGNTIDERLYELIMQSQAYRIDDQRSELGGRQSAVGEKEASGVNESNAAGEKSSKPFSPRGKEKKLTRATSTYH